MCKLTQQDILDFEQSVIDLKAAKKLELELRKKIIAHFRYGDKVEGVVHKSFDGMEVDIAITLKLSRKIEDVDALDTIWSDLTQDQRDSIVYKPSLKVKEYKALCENDEEGSLIDIISEKPSLASVVLKFEE